MILLTLRFEPFSFPTYAGDDAITRIRYPEPTGVAAAIVALMEPEPVPASVPIVVGEAKLPEGLDNCAVNVLLLFQS